METREDPEPKWIRMMEAERDTATTPATESGEATGTAQLPVPPIYGKGDGRTVGME